jgi:hypothetical protein
LSPEDLLTGPQVLGVTYEFWENLVYRYLKDPNFHDKVIWNEICEGQGGLSLDRFTEREVIYLTLTSVLKKEEIKFFYECRENHFDPYAECYWDVDLPLPIRRFIEPHGHQRIIDRDYFVFDAIVDRGQGAPQGYSTCAYHQPTKFRRWHHAQEELTLEGCKGISSRHYNVKVDSAFHLQWISEYVNACRSCQEEADDEIRILASEFQIHRHRPRFHPAFFWYTGRLSEERDVKKLHWYPHLEECPESEEGEQWEPRPPAAEFFIQILEQHCMELAQPLFQGLFGSKATSNWSIHIKAEQRGTKKRKFSTVITPRRSLRLKKI